MAFYNVTQYDFDLCFKKQNGIQAIKNVDWLHYMI